MEKQEILEKLENELQIKTPKDMTSEEMILWTDIIKNIDPVENEKAKNQEIMRFINQKNRLNDKKVMLKTLETQLENLDLTIDTHKSKIYFSLKQKGINTIYDIVCLGTLEKLDSESITVINKILLELGINIDDKEQCKDLITRYNTEKNPDIVRLMEMFLDDLDLSARTFNCLKKRELNTVYDIVKFNYLSRLEKIRSLGPKSLIELKQKFMEYGIDLDNRMQCEELMNKYNNQTINQKETEISELKKKYKLEDSNRILEKKLDSKKETLRDLKNQLERKEYLQQQLIECDKEFKRLAKQYKSLNSKESSNSHGTK